ncbi:MAG TPA: hypothetical protein VD968_16365 [Pyrinomonadaceae bacterium]|nr:hypothetical protein [Pyrinomonadaceae bacterium]
MRKLLLLVVPFLLVAGAEARAKNPPGDVLGVRLDMSETEARRRLDKIGRRPGMERMKQEVWEVRDPLISHVIVRFRDGKVRWVIAQARAEGPRRMRYADVASTARAQHKTDGTNHTYIWRVRARRGRPGYVVVAGGSDPQYLTSYRLLRTFDDQ